MRVVVSFVVGVCLLAVATLANAADPEPAPEPTPPPASTVREPAPAPPGPSWRGAVLPDQWKKSIPRSKALDVPQPPTRDEDIQRVTLKETIAIALENNPGIAARRLDPARFGANILGAQSIFDPALGLEAAYNRTVTPNASVLSSLQTSVIEDRYVNGTLQKLFRSGTQLSIASNNDRLDNNASYISLRPQYQPQLNLSVVQPLLRDFGWDFTYLVVRVAERNADASVYTYEADLANFVQSVINAYWQVVGARENVAVRQEAKALADRTVEENEARVRVGLFAPVAVLEAQADAASRLDQLIQAENTLAVQRQQLAQLAFYRPNDSFVPRTLEPVEDVNPEDVHPDLDQTLAIAVEDRPELKASALGVEARQINERITSNALLPRLDLFGSYGVNGISGQSQAPPGRPVTLLTEFPDQIEAVGGKCQRPAIMGNKYQCTFQTPVGAATSPFAGDPGRAYDRMFTGNYDSYSVGVRFSIPFGNAQAEADNTISRIERDQAELNHRELLSQVTLEVRRTISDLIAGRQRIETSRVAVSLAEENLRNQEKRHEVGMATTKDLLDFQTRLSDARFAEVTAKFQYNIAVAAWRRAQGHLLDHYQIYVERPGKHTPPWFARF
jgi:HAE1 family hydrophobic/amphiphilic exporter-1